MDVLLGHGEHAARAAGRVIDGRGGARAGQGGVVVGEQQVDHQLDDLARGVVLPGVLVVRFGKAADEFFEDVAHLQIGDAGGVQVGLAGGEFLEHHVEHVLLGHGGQVRPKRFEALQYLAHVGGKGVAVGPEVGLQIIGGVQQPREGEGAGVVELVPRGIAQHGFFQRGARKGPRRLQHHFLGGLQHAVEAADDGEGQDDFTILVRFEHAGELVGYGPDKVGFFGNGGGKGHERRLR